MFLTDDEIRELTGKRQRKAQMESLRFLGIAHKARADGSLVVLRSHAEAVLSDKPDGKVKEPPSFKFDWSDAKAA